jgi:hypothetical protein
VISCLVLTFRRFGVLAFLPGCIVTVQPLTPPTCPPPEVIYVLNPNLRQMAAFWACMRGPGVRPQSITGNEYVPCEWLVECMGLDKNQDGFLDLQDYALWQRTIVREVSP